MMQNSSEVSQLFPGGKVLPFHEVSVEPKVLEESATYGLDTTLCPSCSSTSHQLNILGHKPHPCFKSWR